MYIPHCKSNKKEQERLIESFYKKVKYAIDRYSNEGYN